MISIFNNHADTTPVGEISITDFLLDIKHGRWRNQVESVRMCVDKTQRDRLKKMLPAVTISGTFKQRREVDLISHSGFICIDIDSFSDKEVFVKDEYTYAIFKSVSGKGLVVIAKCKPDKHKQSYKWLSNYYFKKYGIAVDPAPSNVASLRYVSYDPDIYINQNSKVAGCTIDEPKRLKTHSVFLTQSTFDRLIQYVVDNRINIAESYHEYLTIGFALAHEFGESGRGYFHQLSSISTKFSPQHCDKQYDYCLRDYAGKPITIGTLYYRLKQIGVPFPKDESEKISSAIVVGKTVEERRQHLVKSGVSETEAQRLSKIEPSQIITDTRSLVEGLMAYLYSTYDVKINELSKTVEINGEQLTDEKMNSIYIEALKFFNSNKIKKDLIENILFSENTKRYHPLFEYIRKQRESRRGDVALIDEIISTIETDTPNASIFIRKWLISLIAAIHGNPVRYVLALTGVQKTGKTEWFRRLLPKDLKRYYAESNLTRGKDDELLMTQRLIIMDDEMSGRTKEDEKRFKELTSKDIFTLRKPFGRSNDDYKRLAVLCGTSNDSQVINDPTGNTRIIPINVISINKEKYNSINKDELFISLVNAYENGEEWELNKQELEILENIGKRHELFDYELELISQYFVPNGLLQLTSTEIKQKIESMSGMKIQNHRKFGIALKKYFGEPKIIRRNGLFHRVYSVEEKTEMHDEKENNYEF